MAHAQDPVAIVVTTAGGRVNTPGFPVSLDEDNEVAKITAFLDFDKLPAAGGAQAHLELTQSKMKRAFLRRCSFSKLPAHLVVWDTTSVLLRLAFTGAFWSRILNEYVTSGFLSLSFTDIITLAAGLDSLTIKNPNELIIVPGDLVACDSFDRAGVAGRAGRGRQGSGR